MTNEAKTGVSAGATAKCSSASWAPDWNSAQWTGFTLSISAHGTASVAISMTISSTGAGVSCGHAYAAIAIPEVRMVMTKKQAISRQKDETERRMGY
jgi:hypothetical protein